LVAAVWSVIALIAAAVLSLAVQFLQCVIVILLYGNAALLLSLLEIPDLLFQILNGGF
jgi:hypothetical protein